MNDRYLWNKRNRPRDPFIAKIERVLAAKRYGAARTVRPLRLRLVRVVVIAAAAAAAVAMLRFGGTDATVQAAPPAVPGGAVVEASPPRGSEVPPQGPADAHDCVADHSASVSDSDPIEAATTK